MALEKLNKYILMNIFSFIENKRTLGIIKYNKNIISKLEISLYEYQKIYFYKIVTPVLKENEDYFISNYQIYPK